MWVAVLVAGFVGLTFTMFFGPAVARSKVQRRLRSGSSVLAQDELVTLTGTVRDSKELVEALLSTRRGVFIHATATLPEADENGPVTLQSQRMVPFEIDTNAGVVLVDGTSAEVAIKPKAVVPRDVERERAFMVAHGRGPEAAPVATFRELVIEPGMRVAVHGVALIETRDRAERGYRDAVPTRARIIATPGYPIAIGPAPKR